MVRGVTNCSVAELLRTDVLSHLATVLLFDVCDWESRLLPSLLQDISRENPGVETFALFGRHQGASNESWTVPQEVTAITGLRVLKLSATEITAVEPVDFSRLSHLVELELSYNRNLKELPEGLQTLPKLKELHIHGNGFRCRFARRA